MKIRTKAAAIAIAAAAIIVGSTSAAWATNVYGDKYCSAGYTVTTGTTSGSGSVAHGHLNHTTGASSVKSWTNTTTTTRYWNAGYEDIFYTLSSGGTMTAYSAICLN